MGGSGGSGQVTQESVNEFASFLTDNLSGCTSQSASASVQAINISSMLSSSRDMYDRYQSIPAPIRTVVQAVDILPAVNGDCGGTLSITAPDMNSFPISVSLNQFCVTLDGENTTIHGDFNVNGQLDSNDNLTQLSTTSTGISINTSSESLTIGFNLSSTLSYSGSGDLSGLNATITSISVLDNNLNQQYSLTNTTIQVSDPAPDVTQINTSGTYIDPALGTFTFSTPSGLTLDETIPNEETLTGDIQINGANNSDILVTINDNDDIIFQADADGNGTTDFSETVNCSSLDSSDFSFPTF
jgi:hypothetical protein